MMSEEKSVSLVEPADLENDLARSAWHDKAFAVWFAPFAKKAVLFNGARGEDFFRECGEFAKIHKAAPAESGDGPDEVLESASAREWFRSIDFAPLPGGRTHKPTTWQMEKARKYLASRHNTLLAEQLADAERVRADGDGVRADMLASSARKLFSSFSDTVVQCKDALDNEDAIIALAESTPPLFLLDGEVGRLLNRRLKPGNFGVILADQKIGKTTSLMTVALAAARHEPTLFISTGDEDEEELNGRVATNLTCMAVEPEYAGTFGVPVPDCAHNAAGTCPINKSGVPRQVKDWKVMVEGGVTPLDVVNGTADGCRAIDGGPYAPCCRCFPTNDGTPEDMERRKNWKSAVWWRRLDVPLVDRETLRETKKRFRLECAMAGGKLKIAPCSSGTLTVQGLYDLLEMLDRTENFVPRVIVLDYADLMKQEQGRDSDKDHDGMRRIWEGLSALRTKLKILLITATQTNRTSDGAETLTRRMIGRSTKAADNCTWMVTINQTVQERRAHVMRMSMLYARKGAFDVEHQALCCQWHEVQDAFAFSMPVFCKIKNETKERD
ncbi:MAG: hypothetical protein BWY66_00550 [bacterium ADurb.Bin374]|nr:MAG: hypothetical protein BWY66_00550 [bacterium ADurb.Bin374]